MADALSCDPVRPLVDASTKISIIVYSATFHW